MVAFQAALLYRYGKTAAQIVASPDWSATTTAEAGESEPTGGA
jgi:hypothetical protein